MIIFADTREQLPYTFDKWPVEVKEDSLSTGDYSLPGFEDVVAIERKTLDDLINCLMGKNRIRFEKELTRARFYELFAVVVESDLITLANGNYQSNMKPHAALQTISAFHVRYGIPFLFCGGRSGAEYIVYSLLSKYLYEIEKRFKLFKKSEAS
ncbi:MAG: hypothetical protein K8S18_03115 [Desulfobacula sp.]|nr:hypothetical protein [Desulfobacula sp.]